MKLAPLLLLALSWGPWACAWRLAPAPRTSRRLRPTAVADGGASAAAPPPPKRVLVLGGSGFVGREVCRRAVAKGYTVTSISRRGENPLPDDAALASVAWVRGDVVSMDEADLAALARECDACVHAVGLLFDVSTPGAGTLNLIVSGSKSTPGPESTYDNVTRKTALKLLAAITAARAETGSDGARLPPAFCFVSAAEAGWPDVALGPQVEEYLAPGWLKRYLAAKRAVEAALLAADAAGDVRAAIFRPSLIWDWSKLDVLPVIPVFDVAAALGVPFVDKTVRVETLAAAVVEALADGDDDGNGDGTGGGGGGGAIRGVQRSPQMEAIAPRSVTRAPGPFDTLTSGLASVARLPFGVDVATPLAADAVAPGALPPRAAAAPAPSALRLYEFEACPFCRRVRETATHLDLELQVFPCGAGSAHRARVDAAACAAGREKGSFPYLEDDAAGVALFESADIVAHLTARYGPAAGADGAADGTEAYFLPSTFVTGWLPSLLRFGRGAVADSRRDDAPCVGGGATGDTAADGGGGGGPFLELWSYEGNQFCRLVREALVELDLPYTLRSAGKGSPRRAELAALTGGSTQCPYLRDARTGAALAESAEIVRYLFDTYGPPPRTAPAGAWL